MWSFLSLLLRSPFPHIEPAALLRFPCLWPTSSSLRSSGGAVRGCQLLRLPLAETNTAVLRKHRTRTVSVPSPFSNDFQSRMEIKGHEERNVQLRREGTRVPGISCVGDRVYLCHTPKSASVGDSLPFHFCDTFLPSHSLSSLSGPHTVQIKQQQQQQQRQTFTLPRRICSSKHHFQG